MANYHFYKFYLEDEIIDEENLVFIPGYERNEAGSIIPKGVKDIKNPYLGRPMFSVVVDLYFIQECLHKYSTELLDFLNYQFESFQYEKEKFLDHTELLIENHIASHLTHSGIIIGRHKAMAENGERIWRVGAEKDKVKLLNVLKWVERKRGELIAQRHDEKRSEEVDITWDGETDLCELIYVLSKSGKIKKGGIPIDQNELADFFCKIFGVNVNGRKVNDLILKRFNTKKGQKISGTFIDSLREILLNYAMQVESRKGMKDS